jgi:type II secretory pathway component PulM
MSKYWLLRHLCSTHVAAAVLTIGAYLVIVISAYFQFSEPTERGVERLQKVLDELNIRDAKDIVISADVNARSASWHDVKTDRRGEIVDEFVTTNGLEIINRGDQPHTFESLPRVSQP